MSTHLPDDLPAGDTDPVAAALLRIERERAAAPEEVADPRRRLRVGLTAALWLIAAVYVLSRLSDAPTFVDLALMAWIGGVASVLLVQEAVEYRAQR